MEKVPLGLANQNFASARRIEQANQITCRLRGLAASNGASTRAINERRSFFAQSNGSPLCLVERASRLMMNMRPLVCPDEFGCLLKSWRDSQSRGGSTLDLGAVN